MNDPFDPNSSQLTIPELERQAIQVRLDILEMIYEAQAGHPGGSLSAADILTALYFRMMHINPQFPQWPDRDRFILSKGHACPVWYAVLANRGYFDRATPEDTAQAEQHPARTRRYEEDPRRGYDRRFPGTGYLRGDRDGVERPPAKKGLPRVGGRRGWGNARGLGLGSGHGRKQVEAG